MKRVTEKLIKLQEIQFTYKTGHTVSIAQNRYRVNAVLVQDVWSANFDERKLKNFVELLQ